MYTSFLLEIFQEILNKKVWTKLFAYIFYWNYLFKKQSNLPPWKMFAFKTLLIANFRSHPRNWHSAYLASRSVLRFYVLAFWPLTLT